MLVILAALTYLRRVVPPHYLERPLLLLDAVKGNLGARTLVYFLLYWAIPWYKCVREATRANNASRLDLAWYYFLPIFRATGKHNYAQMRLLYTSLSL